MWKTDFPLRHKGFCNLEILFWGGKASENRWKKCGKRSLSTWRRTKKDSLEEILIFHTVFHLRFPCGKPWKIGNLRSFWRKMGNFPPLINLRFQHLFFPYDTREKDFSLHTLFLILNGFSTRFSTYVENLWKEWRFSSFKTRTNSFAESFDQTFSKVCAGGGREALREVCEAYGKSLATSTSCRRRNSFNGVFLFAKLFLLRLFCQKKKRNKGVW